MEYTFLLVVSNTILLVGACVTFIMPLRRRENWWRWLPVGFVMLVGSMVLGYHSEGMMIFVYYLLSYLVMVLLVSRTTELTIPDSCYCAVWIFMTAVGVEEIWLMIRLARSGTQSLDLMGLIHILVFAGVIFTVLSKTVARWMPRGDVYQVSPGQLICGTVLGGMYVALSYLFLLPQNTRLEERVLIGLCQICCLCLLILQTEIAKRKLAEKRLDVLNVMWNFGAQQYHTGLQNMKAVNQKCRELDEKIRQMEQYLPETLREEAQKTLEDARMATDTAVKSGNEVLDMVLTEKKLLAQTNGTQLSCVADGKLLAFMEVVDIYALFTYALEVALDAVGQMADESHRLVDLLICENQNFLVINMTHPVNDTIYKKHSRVNQYKIMVVRRIVEKYHGMHAVERHDGFFTLKLLIPLSQNRK